MSLEDVGLNLFLRLYHMVPVLLTLAPGLALTVWSRRRVMAALRNPGHDTTSLTGTETARALLDAAGVSSGIGLISSDGPLATFYDRARQEIRLARAIDHARSPALSALAAHEAGHAIQDARGFRPLRIRTPLVFVAGLGSSASWLVILAGLMMDDPSLAMRGVLVYLASLVAGLLLIPIELDANRRVRQILLEAKLDDFETDPAFNTALDAAAWDTLAATLPLSTMPASTRIVQRMQRMEAMRGDPEIAPK